MANPLFSRHVSQGGIAALDHHRRAGEPNKLQYVGRPAAVVFPEDAVEMPGGDAGGARQLVDGDQTNPVGMPDSPGGVHRGHRQRRSGRQRSRRERAADEEIEQQGEELGAARLSRGQRLVRELDQVAADAVENRSGRQVAHQRPRGGVG